MPKHDILQRFLFEQAPVRGQVAHLNATYQAIVRQHPYPKRIQQLLGESMISCVFMASTIQFKGLIQLQFQGDARLPLLLVQCTDELKIRAYARYQEHLKPKDYNEAFLSGQMTCTINPSNQTQMYQSIVPLQSTSMSENIMHYFAQSEQISTYIQMTVDSHQVSGFLLQLMPSSNTLEQEQFWEYATVMGKTITPRELSILPHDALLHRLYHETQVRLFEEQPILFQCRCSREKMIHVLKSLGQADLEDLLKEQHVVDIHCDFCNTHYTFDAIDVTLLFRSQ